MILKELNQLEVPCGGRLEDFHHNPESWKVTKREPGAWGYNWATLLLEDIKYRDLVLQVGGWTQG
jgi:hypothetical protein